MKNDVKKVNEITTEMRINDLIYKIIDDELDDMIYDCDELDEEFEKLYFAKRVLSVFQNNDMPIRAAVGLLDNVDIIEALYEDKDEFGKLPVYPLETRSQIRCVLYRYYAERG